MNEQESFWSGSFGDQYTTRNRVQWQGRTKFWRMILQMTEAKSALEVGCNAGWNLMALRQEDALLALRGIDLNFKALSEAADEDLDVREMGAAEVGVLWPEQFDLVFTAGVLIHVAPQHLRATMESIVAASNKYVLAVEYAWHEPEEINYRGYDGKLWKRPYGEMYRHLGLSLVATGSLTQAQHGFDDCTFWLLRK